MEVELVKCDCCGLKEECTIEYIEAIKAKFNGKWLCGLCSEAVGDEVNSTGVEDAVRAHMSFCSTYKSSPASRVADGMRQMLRKRSGELPMDGLMLISYCILYQSAAEEVVIRGWPLETAGLFTAEFSSRSFTLLSGRITEWPEGQMSSTIREVNSTWMIKKWSASVMRFEPNTWLIEYRKNCLLENHNGLVLAVEFIFFRISKFMQIMKQKFWYLSELRYHTSSTSKATGFSVPT